MIPDEIITQIREAADIVQVVGQHVQLRKAGRNWKGLCPFHGEKTPSFNVSPDKGFFHCFGCQKHGDVFTFVMELEGKSFVEAAEQLAGRFNIQVPRIEESPELRKARGERVAMLELNKVATAFYRAILADPVRGEPGRAYLAGRGIHTETADAFLLGYAPPEWDALAEHLKSQRADLELAVKVGLVAPRPRTGGYYDRIRDRLVCPIVVPGGDVVGFSSRVIASPDPEAAPAADPPPKYINSPESAVYKKSKLLFGLAQAREGIAAKKRAVLVEGNFDVISLHQAGFKEVVAPLGTALTPEQIGTLRRLAEKVVLLYDGDKAGYKATMHALLLCSEAEVPVQVIKKRAGPGGLLGGGDDPDSMVAAGKIDELQAALDNARDGVEFMAFEVWGKASTPEQKARAVDEAARLVAKFGTQTKRDLIVHTLATALQVDVGVVAGAVNRANRQDRSAPPSYPQRAPHPAGPPSGPGSSEDAPGPVAPFPHEEIELLTLLVDHPGLIATPEADKAFWLLTDGRLRDMYSAARAGQPLVEYATGKLPPSVAKQVLSAKYTQANAAAQLAIMIQGLESRKAELDRTAVKKDLSKSRHHGNKTVERLLAQLGVAKRIGDLEQVARLEAALASEEQGKQVD